MDLFGRGLWVHLHFVVLRQFAPFILVSDFLKIRAQGPKYFMHEDRSPLTRFQFSSAFCLVAVGALPVKYSTHSARIRVATEGVRTGLAEEQVICLGSLRSHCYAGYIRPDMID